MNCGYGDYPAILLHSRPLLKQAGLSVTPPHLGPTAVREAGTRDCVWSRGQHYSMNMRRGCHEPPVQELRSSSTGVRAGTQVTGHKPVYKEGTEGD